MHVAVGRAQRNRKGVVIGRCRALVATDEAHGRAASALARKEQEVADDHPQVVQIPIQRFEILGRLHYQVAQTLDSRGHPWRTLGDVGAQHVVPEVEGVRLLDR